MHIAGAWDADAGRRLHRLRVFGGDGVERWGDYSDAVVIRRRLARHGDEWIQGNVYGSGANWNTSILKLNPRGRCNETRRAASGRPFAF